MKECLRKLGNLEERYKIIIISTFVFGILAHGYMFFNKFSFLDDVVSLTGVGATYSSGRWFLGVLSKVMQWVFNGSYSVPMLTGVLTIILFATTNVLLASIFEISNKWSCVILGGLIIVFPATTALYSFMFTSGYYAFSILLAVFAVYVIRKANNKIIGCLISILSIALSMGIYQAYFDFTILCFLFLFILQIMDTKSVGMKEVIKSGVVYVACLIGGIAAYLIINKIFLALMSVELSSYRGLNAMYSAEVFNLDFHFLLKTFLNRYDNISYFAIYIEKTAIIYDIVLIMIAIIILYNVILFVKAKEIMRAVLMLLAIACVPIALNPFALINTDMVTSLVQLPKVLIFLFFVILIEKSQIRKEKLRRGIFAFGCIIMLYTNMYYMYFANRCYLAADLHKSETISWMTTLVTQIKSLEGFNDEMEIAFVNNVNLEDNTFVFDKSILSEDERFYNWDIRKQYVWKYYMGEWCGFQMKEVDEQTYERLINSDEVDNMKSYPDDGSMKIIDNIIVVKF